MIEFTSGTGYRKPPVLANSYVYHPPATKEIVLTARGHLAAHIRAEDMERAARIPLLRRVLVLSERCAS